MNGWIYKTERLTTCADCGHDLPAALAQASRGRCIDCQERHERREALRA